MTAPINGNPFLGNDYKMSYERQEFEEREYFLVKATRPGNDPQEVAHFFNEQAAKALCVRYNLHEQLMKVCLLAGVVRANQKKYFKDRNHGLLIQSKQAEKNLDQALEDVQKL